MGKSFQEVKKLGSVLLAIIIMSIGILGGYCEVNATEETNSKKEYNILFWSPAPHTGLCTNFDFLCNLYGQLSTDEMTFQIVKQYDGTQSAPKHFEGTEVLSEEYDIVYILMPLVELNENDIAVLSKYLKAGGRIVMHGEWNGVSTSSKKTNNRIGNENLSKAALALGTSFTVTDINLQEPCVADINTDANLLGGTALADPGTITFGAFAQIDFANPAEVIASYNGAAGIVDQAVEKGRITIFSDCNFYYTFGNDAVNDLLIRFVTNSVENMDIVEDGGNPNESMGLHSHTLQAVSGNVTCTTDGTLAHYKCTGESCQKLFTDKEATNETTLEELTVSALGHAWNYSVSENVITVSCNNGGCEYQTQGLSLILNVTTPYVYSGVSYNGVWIENHITPVTNESAGDVIFYHTDEKQKGVGEALPYAPTDAGRYVATITLGDKTAKAAFEIVPKELTEAMVEMAPTSFSCNNLEQGPVITVTDGGLSLNPNIDYELSGDIRATEVNDYQVTIEGKGNYTGRVLKTWSIVDDSAPKGSIEIAENKWTDFLDSVTFDLFFKEKQTVTIYAEDEGSGIDKVWYYISDTELTEEEVKMLADNEWVEMEMTNGSGTFDLYPDAKYIIYAKITDKVLNTTYLSSDGFILDATKPVILGLEEGKTYCEFVKFTVSENYLNHVTMDGETVEADTFGVYKIHADNKEHTICVTDKAGNSASVLVCVNRGHMAGEPVEENRKEATCITDGSYDEVSYCTICGVEFRRTHKTLEQTGHQYGEALFTWADDYGSAKATFTCQKNEAHVKIVDAVVTNEVTKEATQVQKGKRTYTAKAEMDGKTYSDCKIKEIEKLQSEPQPEIELTPEQIEKVELVLNEKLKVDQTGKKIKIAWGKVTQSKAGWTSVTDADGYDVYVQYCGMKYKKKPTKTVGAKTNTVTVTKINGKKLNLKKNYKIHVVAFKMVDGKKVKLGRTVTAHIVGRKNTKFTNVKEVKVKKSNYTLQVGKSAKIKASTVLVDKSKKQLTNAHAKEFRYATDDKSVAIVSKKGKITAVGIGKCTIYVYARNGYAKKVSVTVK